MEASYSKMGEGRPSPASPRPLWVAAVLGLAISVAALGLSAVSLRKAEENSSSLSALPATSAPAIGASTVNDLTTVSGRVRALIFAHPVCAGGNLTVLQACASTADSVDTLLQASASDDFVQQVWNDSFTSTDSFAFLRSNDSLVYGRRTEELLGGDLRRRVDELANMTNCQLTSSGTHRVCIFSSTIAERRSLVVLVDAFGFWSRLSLVSAYLGTASAGVSALTSGTCFLCAPALAGLAHDV
jgi:hypothetical protein